MITFQNALSKVGDQGKYQFLLFSLLVVIIISKSFALMFPTYAFLKPTLICDGIPCLETSETCAGDYIIDPNFKYKNFVTEYHLFCGKSLYISVASSITFIGAIIGGTVNSHISDNYGRKFALIFSQCIQSAGFLAIYFSSTIENLVAANFFMGFGSTGTYLLLTIMINEVCGTVARQIYSMGILVFWSFGEIILAYLFYQIPDWRTIYLCFIIIPSILSIILTLPLLESPKFYYSQKKYQETIQVLNKIAKVNGKPQLQDIILEPVVNEQSSYSILDLFRFQHLKLPTIGFMIFSFCLNNVYYGVQYGIKYMISTDSLHQMGALLGLVELLTYLLLAQFIQSMKRKKTSIICFSLQTLVSLSLLYYGLYQFKIQCVNCLSGIFLTKLAYICFFQLALLRMFNTFGFGVQSLFATEFYATPLRTLGASLLFSSGLFGSFSSSYINDFAKFIQINPFMVLSGITFIGLLGSLLTKETLGKSLQDSIYHQLPSESDLDE